MFEKNYKNAMDGIKPSDEAIEKTKKAMNAQSIKKQGTKNFVRIAAIACLLFAFIATSVFAGFKINDEFINYQNNVSDEDSEYRPNTDKIIYDPNIPTNFDGLKSAESYEQIKQLIQEIKDSELYIYGSDFELEVEEDATEEGVREDITDGIESDIKGDAPEHSDTNNQVSGVQEGDIVKNDGRYIYYCSINDKTVYIVSVDNGQMEQVSSFSIDDENYPNEMFLIGDRLALVSQTYITHDKYTTDIVLCTYYDISDKSNPKKLDDFTQDGYYVSGRVVDGTVYIISTKYTYMYADINDGWIPEIDEEPIDYKNILIPDSHTSSAFTVITAYDAIGGEAKSEIAIMGSAHTIYSGRENIYITASSRTNDSTGEVVASTNTKIYRIALNGGELVATGVGCVPGSVRNQFWIDEQNGRLRVASVIQPVMTMEDFEGDYAYREFLDSYNKVYCLGDELEIIGESDDLGVTETIRSVRYIGDIAYVVTFRQTDPLYAIDLSDPTSPKTLSELKIDGFSTYMHGYGSDYLLGIGYDATSEGVTNGIKLTMFDISDNTDIFDVSTYTYGWNEETWSHSNALSNHKAVLVDYKKEIIAIPLCTDKLIKNEYEHYDYDISASFVFFGFDGKNITEKGTIEIETDSKDWYNGDIRGLYIGDYGYIVSNEGIISVSLNKLETVSQISFE